MDVKHTNRANVHTAKRRSHKEYCTHEYSSYLYIIQFYCAAEQLFHCLALYFFVLVSFCITFETACAVYDVEFN